MARGNATARGVALCLLAMVTGASVTAAAADPAAKATGTVFARVGDTVITSQEYDAAVAVAARGKFYHGKAPDAEIEKLRRDVGDRLVNNVLLVNEAKRRRLVPDTATVQKTLDGYDERYKSSPEWKKNRAEALPALRRKLEEDSLRTRLEESVRALPPPTVADIEAYYNAHKEKFTEPEQVRVSIILLKVDPSSPKAQWEAARQEGIAIVKRLRGGADFAQLASLHSADASATKGGDLGYVHRGMLPEPAQEALDRLQAGAIADPVALLEGVAVLRLDDRRVAKLNPLAAVQVRARDLLQRDRAQEAWDGLILKLRKDVAPRIDESRYTPVAAAHGAAAGSPVR